MSSGPNQGREDLLHSATGGFGNDYAVDYQQADNDPPCNACVILDTCPYHGLRSLYDSSPRWDSSHPGSILLDPTTYQTELARANPGRFSHLTISRAAFATPEHLLSPNSFETTNHSIPPFEGSATRVRPQTMLWEERAFVDTGTIDLSLPDLNRVSWHENNIGFTGTQAQNLLHNNTTQYQPVQATPSGLSWSPVQDQSHGWSGHAILGPPTQRPETQAVAHQDRIFHGGMADGDPTSAHLHSLPDSGSHGPDEMPSLPDPEPSGVQPQDRTTAPAKCLVCPICKRQLRDRPTLRHHLEIHDPAKTSRYKCSHRNCIYASRYPKDVRRHKLVHEKPTIPRFVCLEPGCGRRFHRNDWLLRHHRAAHLGSTPARSTTTTAASRLGEEFFSVSGQLIDPRSVPNPEVSQATSFESDPSNNSSDPAPNDSSFIIGSGSSFNAAQTAASSFNGCLDPRLMSPSSASGSYCFSDTGSSFPR